MKIYKLTAMIAIMLMASDAIFWNPLWKAEITVADVPLADVSPSAAKAETAIADTTIAPISRAASRFFQDFIFFTSLSKKSMP